MGPTTITVCGSSGSFPAAGRACSSYLVSNGAGVLVLDLGNGSLANVQRWVDPATITDVFLSHAHHDHLADLVGLLQLTSYGATGPSRLCVRADARTCEAVQDIQRQHAPNDRTLELIALAPGERHQVASFDCEVFPVNHSLPGLAIRIEDSAGRVVAYTGDSAPSDGLLRCASDADVLIAEATWLEGADSYPEGVHMTGTEAGNLARQAGASRLLVTHFWPEAEPDAIGRQAAVAFGGPTIVAEDNLVLTVGARS